MIDVYKLLGFLPMVRLYQRRWQVSVPSASANHNVVSLGLTNVWEGLDASNQQVSPLTAGFLSLIIRFNN